MADNRSRPLILDEYHLPGHACERRAFYHEVCDNGFSLAGQSCVNPFWVLHIVSRTQDVARFHGHEW